MKARTQKSQRTSQQAAAERHRACLHRKIERPAHPANAVTPGQPRHHIEHRGEQVRVFMRVEVRGLKAGIDDAPHLRVQFPFNRKLAPRQREQQVFHVARVGAAGDQRFPAHQHEVTSDVERRRGLSQFHRVIESRAVGHQRGGGQNAVAVCLYDALVDVAGEAEVIRVDHQPLQNRPSLIRRNFFGLARKSLSRPVISRVVMLMDSYNCGLTSSWPSVP